MSNIIAEQFAELAEGILEPEEIEQMEPFFENLKKRFPADFHFTELQKEAIRKPEFWKNKKNKIVLGSTSAGKTLVAELNIAYQICCREKKVLYLVPLKVLTTEKQDQFLKDFAGKDVYISSSDYQEQDYELGRGEYDIGILVYEKFFALLAENKKEFLDQCSLIVVDELHMLSAAERGPKLEFSIEKLRFSHRERIAVLSLTTSECDVTLVKKWLGEKTTAIIQSEHRPIEIEERFFYCDSTMEHPLMQCFISGIEQEAPCFDLDHRIPDHDFQFFQLYQVLRQHPDEHIIIFCNSKHRSIQLVDRLCNSGVLAKDPVKLESFPDIVDTDMDQSRYDSFRQHMERYRIAYHNAGLTLSLREFVESQFREGSIRIIVATETLTMGVNTPTDIMILYDYKVHRGSDTSVSLTYQEYKNAIGRAGRLGISTVGRGISYLLVGREQGQMQKVINRYVFQCRKERITSAVHEPDERDYSLSMVLAPFYLNILNSGDFRNKDIAELLENGLGKYDTDSDELAEEIVSVLSGNNPCNEKVEFPRLAEATIGYDEMQEENVKSYNIVPFGVHMSPFALSLRTYKRIHNLFVEPPERVEESARQNHLPAYHPEAPFSLDPEDAEKGIPMYFLDVMFHVCGMYEIKQNTNYLNVPKINSKDQERRNQCQKAVLKFFRNKVQNHMLWDNSQLQKFRLPETEDIAGEHNLMALFRTVVLYYWIQGFDVRDIRRVLDLPDLEEYYIYTSELESLGELCAYQLEAISKGLKIRSEYNKLSDMFYALSIRIKYGMTNDLARVANKHIRGLHRARLLKIEKAAKEQYPLYSNVTDFILKNTAAMHHLGVTDAQLLKLRQILRDVLKANEDRLRNEACQTSMVDAAFWNYYDTLISMNADSISALGSLFNNHFDTHFKILQDTEPCCGEIRSCGMKLWLCPHKDYRSSQDIYAACGTSEAESGNSIFLYKNGNLEDRDSAFHCMTLSDFGTLMLRCIVFTNSDNLSAAGKLFISMLRSRLNGSDITEPHTLENALEHEIQADVPAQSSTAPTQVLNIYGNVTQINGDMTQIAQQTNTQIGTQINIQKMQMTIQNWNNALSALRQKYISADPTDDPALLEEQEELFFEEAEKQIALPDTPQHQLETNCREIMEHSTNPDFDEMQAAITDDPTLYNLVLQAFYAEKMIADMDLLDDYSPAVVLYGKSLEHCLRARLKPVILRKAPRAKMKSNKTLAKDIRDEDWTLGVFSTALHYEFCDVSDVSENNKPRTAIAGLYDRMEQRDHDFWDKLYDVVNSAHIIRNRASHHGQIITLDDALLLRQHTSHIMYLSAQLPEWADKLPDPQPDSSKS